jgi:tetratricopeptide (TPR) repeat protein
MSLFARLMNRLRRNKNKDTAHDTLVPLLALASSFFQKHDYVAARDLLLRAVEHRNEIQDPSILVWVLETLAWTWTYSDQHRERAEFFSDYITQYPNDAVAYTMRAGSLWYAGELRRAIDDYSRAVELDPKYIVSHMGRGQVYVECGEFSKAIEDLDFAIENLEQAPITDATWRTSVQAYSLSGKAAAHAGLGDFDRALGEFEKSISLCPENAWVYYNRAEAYENRGDRARAIADYKLALRMNNPKLPILKKRYAETKLKTLLG